MSFQGMPNDQGGSRGQAVAREGEGEVPTRASVQHGSPGGNGAAGAGRLLALPAPAWRRPQTQEERLEALEVIHAASDGELLDLLSSQETFLYACRWSQKAVRCGGVLVGWVADLGSPARWLSYGEQGDLCDFAEAVRDWIKDRIVERFREQRHQRAMAAIRSRVRRKYAAKKVRVAA